VDSVLEELDRNPAEGYLSDPFPDEDNPVRIRGDAGSTASQGRLQASGKRSTASQGGPLACGKGSTTSQGGPQSPGTGSTASQGGPEIVEDTASQELPVTQIYHILSQEEAAIEFRSNPEERVTQSKVHTVLDWTQIQI